MLAAALLQEVGSKLRRSGQVLEIGELSLFRWTHPELTWNLFCGDGLAQWHGPRLQRWGLHSLAQLWTRLLGDEAKLVICHAPRHPPTLFGTLRGDLRGAAFASLGRIGKAPLMIVDFRDEVPLTRWDFGLLERAEIYFKRELPTDRQRLLPRHHDRSHRAGLERNLHKLRPISLGLSAWREAALPVFNPKGERAEMFQPYKCFFRLCHQPAIFDSALLAAAPARFRSRAATLVESEPVRLPSGSCRARAAI